MSSCNCQVKIYDGKNTVNYASSALMASKKKKQNKAKTKKTPSSKLLRDFSENKEIKSIFDPEMKTKHVGNLQGLHRLFYGSLTRNEQKRDFYFECDENQSLN